MEHALKQRSERTAELAVAGLLFTTVMIVFYPSFHYGFASDDFIFLSRRSWEHLWNAWVAEGFGRPLDDLYFTLFYRLFGTNPLPFRIVLAFIYFVNTYLVYVFVRRLTGDRAIGCAGAILFAANTVQFRNVYWISCNLLLFATFFFLSALLAYLRYLDERRTYFLWIAFGVALLGLLTTKEDLAIFPVAALLAGGYRSIAMSRANFLRDLKGLFKSTLIFWTIPLVFFGYRIVMTRFAGSGIGCPYDVMKCFESGSANPYRVSLLGWHVLENLARQAYWNLGSFGIYWLDGFNEYQGVFEWREVGGWQYLLIGCFIGFVITLYYCWRRYISWGYLYLGALWFLVLLLPVLFLPTQVYPYYSAFAGLGPIIAVLVLFKGMQGWRNATVARSGLIVFVGLFLLNSIYWTDYNRPRNFVTKASQFLSRLETDLKRLHPGLPAGAQLVFVDVSYWYLGHVLAPSVMYDDPSIRTFSTEDLVFRNNRVYVKGETVLDPRKTFVFTIAESGLQEVTPSFWAIYGGSPPILPQGATRGR